MNVKKVIIATIAVFAVGLVAGAGVSAVQAWKNDSSSLPVASYSDLQNKEQNQVDEFVENQEKEHPDGLKEISVDGKYEQPEVDANGNLVKNNEEQKAPVDNKPSDKKTEEPSNSSSSGSNVSAPTTKTGVITVNESSSLRMRSGAGTDYDVIGSLHRNDKVTILSEKNGWYEIKTQNGTKAWVSAQYVEVK